MKLLPTALERAEALRYVLNVPDGKECVLHTVMFPGPMLELFLVGASGDPPTDAMFYLDKPFPGSQETAYQVWRIRINRRGSPLFAEMTWTPTRHYQYAIRSAPTREGSKWIESDHARAWSDLRRLQALEEKRVGRPRGPGVLKNLTADKVRSDYQSLADADDDRPSRARLAEHYLVSIKTLVKRLKELNVTWPPSE